MMRRRDFESKLNSVWSLDHATALKATVFSDNIKHGELSGKQPIIEQCCQAILRFSVRFGATQAAFKKAAFFCFVYWQRKK
jgi:hypothetical protein